MSSVRRSLKARWVFPVDGEPIPEGVISLEGTRIVAIGRPSSTTPPRDLGNVAILPGLVNAHTHLEFSARRSPLGVPHMPFDEWIREVVAARRAEPDDVDKRTVRRCESVARGLRESVSAGVTTLGEIATRPWSSAPFEQSPLRAIVFLELLGLGPQQTPELVQAARDHVSATVSPQPWLSGISPHAPYTVSPDLVRQSCRVSAATRVPVAMHLAETRAELELLANASGPLFNLLVELGAWHAHAIPRGLRPLDYLDWLSGADRALIVHGNYLADDEQRFLAAHAERMSLIYCPRTHAYFGHDDYALAKLVGLGVNVALGTDSRASNPDLNLLSEMQFVARRHAGVAAHRVLRMGTLNGARALGVDAQVGSLTPGKLADLTIVDLPERDDADPHSLLWDSAAQIRAVYVAGVPQ